MHPFARSAPRATGYHERIKKGEREGEGGRGSWGGLRGGGGRVGGGGFQATDEH